jgi:hypothetical protein
VRADGGKRVKARVVHSWIAVALLAACHGSTAFVKKPLPRLDPVSNLERQQKFAFGDGSSKAQLTAVTFDLPADYHLGTKASGYGGCEDAGRLLLKDAYFDTAFQDFNELFIGAMRMHGYPIDAGISLFEPAKTGDLLVAARVVDAVFNYCTPDIAKDFYRKIGNAYLKIEWSVYSSRDRRIILKTVTEGTTPAQVDTPAGRPGILRPAFVDAVHRLALSESYRALVGAPTNRRIEPSTASRWR